LAEAAPVRRLSASAVLDVRFPEVDAQGVVWHGNYLKYLELGRDAVLALGGLRPSDVLREGYAAPIVECDVRYKAPLRLDDRARVEAELRWEGIPRLDFEYRVVRATDGVVAATATTRQVLTGPEGELVLVLPEFLRAWADRCGLDE
jgi:acyl-CoA thioester hydrolase